MSNTDLTIKTSPTNVEDEDTSDALPLSPASVKNYHKTKTQKEQPFSEEESESDLSDKKTDASDDSDDDDDDEGEFDAAHLDPRLEALDGTTKLKSSTDGDQEEDQEEDSSSDDNDSTTKVPHVTEGIAGISLDQQEAVSGSNASIADSTSTTTQDTVASDVPSGSLSPTTMAAINQGQEERLQEPVKPHIAVPCLVETAKNPARTRITLRYTGKDVPGSTPHKEKVSTRGRKNYMVATDLSGESWHATEWAINTILRNGDEMNVVTIVEDDKATRSMGAKELLIEMIDDLDDLSTVLVGSRGRGAIKGLLLGSISNFLVHNSSVPVMVVRATKKGKAKKRARNSRFMEQHNRSADITDLETVQSAMIEYKIDHVIHLAAQTHVDKSFGESIEFTKNNVLGAHAMLEATRKVWGDREGSNLCNGDPTQNGRQQHSTSRFIYVSTDEVYGAVPLGQPDSKEDSPLAPSNPYSATKAAAEYMVQAYHKSFHLPVIITRSNNVYGPFQYPEKIFPKFIMNMINSEHHHQNSINTHNNNNNYNDNGTNGNSQQNGLMPRLAVLKDTKRGSRHGGLCYIHGSGQHSRTYLYVSDVANALDVILHRGEIGHVYNIGGGYELANIELAQDLIHRMAPPLEVTNSLLEAIPVISSNVNQSHNSISKESKTQTQEEPHQQSAIESSDDKLCIHDSAFSGTRQKEAEQHLRNCQLCQSRIAFVEDRAFNDQRYAVNTTKILNLGWRPTVSFEDGITKTRSYSN
ncbi:hypothetical protein BGZ76_006316 [Entomortierella beljakovae]|nr:hypothetical protein BGZ76_006316 [Entomortierella beljakovae]